MSNEHRTSVAMVVDRMQLRRALVEGFFKEWASEEGIEIRSGSPDDSHIILCNNILCVIFFLNVGSSPIVTPTVLADISVLRMLAPTAAIMIIADNADSESILAAPRAGAQGYLMSTTPPRLALQAASVVLNGGTYFPARPAHKAIIAGETVPASSISPALELDFGTSVLLKERAPVGEPRRRTSNTERILSEVRHGDELAFHHTGFTATLAPPTNESAIAHSTADAPDFHDWSSKQCAILECLCQGDPNKVIGRKLDMPESTVKVHVREIMRKLGVCNRTQAAIAVSRIRNGCEIHFDNNPITAARHRPSG